MDRFAKGAAYFARHQYPLYRDLYEKLAQGQQPDALVITCSDSRIMLSQLFGINAGDLFVLRTAGLMIPPYGTVSGGEQATIEYAVKQLRVKDIIILGHTDCGVVNALLNPNPNLKQEMPGLSKMMRKCCVPPHKRFPAPPTSVTCSHPVKHGEEESPGDRMARLHLLRQLETLQRYPFVAAAEVQLHGCLFDIKRGMVLRYEPLDGKFAALCD
jgi:carbonic anhydrase